MNDEEMFWGEGVKDEYILNESPEKGPRVYDLEERTAQFGEAIIEFAMSIPHSPVTNRLIDQLVGAGRSIGANYCEADNAYSQKEFLKNICICQKEARETKFQLRMIVKAVPGLKSWARLLWREAKELHLIFSAIRKRTPREK